MDFSGITAIYGAPGTGKTALAASIAHERLRAGQRVLWATFYEDKQTLLDSMAKLGYDLSGAEIWEGVLTDPTSTFNQISHLVSHSSPDLLVLDSITQLQAIDVRANVTNLIYRAFKFAGIDAVIISEEPVGALGYIADNLIKLTLEFAGAAVRTMYVEKARGAPAGFAKEFEIVEGRGIVFLDELAPRGGSGRLTPGVPRLDEYLSDARSALVVGGLEASALVASWAALLAKSGLKVLFRSYRGKAPRSVAEAGAVVEVLPPQARYGRHLYDLVAKVEEVGADVVFYDGVEVEAMALGPQLAARLNARKLSSLAKAGVGLVIASAKPLGLASFVDVVVKAGNNVVFSKPYARPLACRAAGDFLECP